LGRDLIQSREPRRKRRPKHPSRLRRNGNAWQYMLTVKTEPTVTMPVLSSVSLVSEVLLLQLLLE